MITKTHTIILTTPRFEIPSNLNVIELLNELIHSNLVNIDYFGSELDNPVDFVDDEMKEEMETTSYLTLHFDQNASDNIDYDIDEDSALNLVISLIMERQIKEVIVDEKDVDIYIY